MGVYSYKSVGAGGRKDKVFLKEILGRIRNLEKNFPFCSDISPIFGQF